jgi:hypothetical protein
VSLAARIPGAAIGGLAYHGKEKPLALEVASRENSPALFGLSRFRALPPLDRQLRQPRARPPR